MIKTDEQGFQYHTEIPDGYKLATIWDFVEITRDEFDYYRPNIGMEYLIQSQDESRYYIHKLSEHIRDVDLIRYIETNQIYIKK